jgi:hypothetical protein
VGTKVLPSKFSFKPTGSTGPSSGLEWTAQTAHPLKVHQGRVEEACDGKGASVVIGQAGDEPGHEVVVHCLAGTLGQHIKLSNLADALMDERVDGADRARQVLDRLLGVVGVVLVLPLD